MRNLISIIKRIFSTLIYAPLHKKQVCRSIIFFGSKYGGWPLLSDETGAESIIFSFGIGEDVSFELGAIDHFGCRIYGFDPTPKSWAWISSQRLPQSFTFLPVGLSASDGSAVFHAPAVATHVSYSLSPRVGATEGETLSVPVLRLESILSRYDLPAPDILKMDIEGFEYEVIRDMLAGPIRPKQLLVEFHHGVYKGLNAEMTRVSVRALEGVGYRIFFVSENGHEYGFCKKA